MSNAPTPSPRPHASAHPDVLIWVDHESSGEYARYAGDLCAAWRTHASVRVWMEPGDPGATPALFGSTPIETPARFSPAGAATLRRALIRQRPTLLLMAGTRAASIGCDMTRKIGLPATAYLALSDRIYSFTSLLRVAQNYLTQSRIIRSVRGVIVPTHGMRYQLLLRDWSPASHYHLLPHCVPTAAVPTPDARAELRRTLGVRDGETHVVCASPRSSGARLDWLLRSWALVEDSGANARLTVVGAGAESAELRALADRLGLARCTLIRPDRPLFDYVASADIAAMTHLYAIHARLPVWAMQAALPIVAMESDGVRMFVSHGQNGCLAPVGDIEAFSRALQDVIRDPELAARLGAGGARRALDYGPEAHRARAAAILSALLAGDAPA